MRRAVAVFLCILLLALPVRAANAATTVHTTAHVTANGSCQVTIEAEIRLDEPARNLRFPIGPGITAVTLNGASASLSQSEGITSVDLSHLDGKTGTYSVSISYVVNTVVQTDDKDRQIVTVPLLYGFPYPVENMSFSVTMPTEFETVPSFRSGYHGQDIERQMTATVNGTEISGSIAQELKDSETLFLELVAPEDMFPAVQTFGGSLGFDALAMGLCAGLAMVFWLLTMRTLPRLSPRRATVPEGICAGQMGTYLVRAAADLPIMVIQWAQLGYLIIHLDDNGRVFLHKKMDMGNERSTFEQRCFRDLFGRKLMMDATGYRFGKVCDKAAAYANRQSNGFRSSIAAGKLFRLIASLVGLFAGVAMGDAIATDHTWRMVLMAGLGVVGFWLSWQIQQGMGCLHLRSKAQLKLSLCYAVAFLVGAFLCNCLSYGLSAVLWSLFAGLCAAYGGQRTDNGQRICSEILGLRRHMRKASKSDLRRILAANRNYYYELAPYALALGLDKRFAERFGDARLPACTWLVSGLDSRTAPEWYTQLREVLKAMNRDRKPTLAERIFGK